MIKKWLNKISKGVDAKEVTTSFWDAYQRMGYAQRNNALLGILQEQFSNQKYLIYGWSIQRLYSRYAEDFLPGNAPLRILELGPGDNLMTTALWMLNKRVEHLTLMDMFKGAFVESPSYHQPMLELVKIIHHLNRDNFNNDYPFDTLSTDRLEQAIQVADGKIHLNSDYIDFVITRDFTTFPLPNEQFNYIYSHATLEHYLDPASSIQEMSRVLEPGGLMVHQIDIRDHRHFAKDPFRYLEQRPRDWNFGDLCFPVNQWRACQFAQAFEAAGFEILEQVKVRREPEKLHGIRLAPEFATMPTDDVAITGIVFVLRKN